MQQTDIWRKKTPKIQTFLLVLNTGHIILLFGFNWQHCVVVSADCISCLIQKKGREEGRRGERKDYWLSKISNWTIIEIMKVIQNHVEVLCWTQSENNWHFVILDASFKCPEKKIHAASQVHVHVGWFFFFLCHSSGNLMSLGFRFVLGVIQVAPQFLQLQWGFCMLCVTPTEVLTMFKPHLNSIKT